MIGLCNIEHAQIQVGLCDQIVLLYVYLSVTLV
jgi:hypothetical protein